MKKYIHVVGLVLSAVCLGLVVYSLALLTSFSLDQNEIQNCNALLAQSKEGYTQFFITEFDFQSCQDRGITIDAPVK